VARNACTNAIARDAPMREALDTTRASLASALELIACL
jgi:hypothetical protein